MTIILTLRLSDSNYILNLRTDSEPKVFQKLDCLLTDQATGQSIQLTSRAELDRYLTAQISRLEIGL